MFIYKLLSAFVCLGMGPILLIAAIGAKRYLEIRNYYPLGNPCIPNSMNDDLELTLSKISSTKQLSSSLISFRFRRAPKR